MRALHGARCAVLVARCSLHGARCTVLAEGDNEANRVTYYLQAFLLIDILVKSTPQNTTVD